VIIAVCPQQEEQFWNARPAKSTSAPHVLKTKLAHKLFRKCTGDLLCAPTAI
jgi:hypothetical protein